MASDSIAERRAQWEGALAIINPQIRGLEDQVHDALSDDLRIALSQRLAALKDQQYLINQAQAKQDAADAAQATLEASGFPALPDSEIAPELLEELQREVADSLAALSGFEALAQAASLNVSLGAPQSKP